MTVSFGGNGNGGNGRKRRDTHPADSGAAGQMYRGAAGVCSFMEAAWANPNLMGPVETLLLEQLAFFLTMFLVRHEHEHAAK